MPYDNNLFSKLHNLYWQIRFTRKDSVKRRYYRYIAVEKKRLVGVGVNNECLRLLCLHLVNLKNARAENNYLDFRKNCLFCR